MRFLTFSWHARVQHVFQKSTMGSASVRHYSIQIAANPIPAAFLRGGTSKGIFINIAHLPQDRDQWTPIFLGIMGSPDPEHGRQLNGMGGGVSSLSKICVVGPPPPSVPADVSYTFVQVAIREAAVDYSGNCGNLSSMIGVFALDEGLVPAPPPEASSHRVRAFNTNTNKVIATTFPIADGVAALDRPEVETAGVPGSASRIVLDFTDPAGARTGRLLPAGAPSTLLELGDGTPLRASLVDATNPSVLVALDDVRAALPLGALDEYLRTGAGPTGVLLEHARAVGAVAMGLDPAAAAQPKIAMLAPANGGQADIAVYALSMGVLHRAVPLTLALAIGVAAGVEGTLAWEIVRRAGKGKGGLVRVQHPSGVVEVGADFGPDGVVRSAQVVRTGRRLMKGAVWW